MPITRDFRIALLNVASLVKHFDKIRVINNCVKILDAMMKLVKTLTFPFGL